MLIAVLRRSPHSVERYSRGNSRVTPAWSRSATLSAMTGILSTFPHGVVSARADSASTPDGAVDASSPDDPLRSWDEMADKSPRQHQSKKSGKTLKEKRMEKKAKQDTK